MDNNQINNINNAYSTKSEYLIYVTIAIVYVSLLTVIINKILGHDRINEICKYKFKHNMTLEEREIEEKRNKECDALMNNYRDKKFSYTIIIGVCSLLIGSYITTVNDTYSIAGGGAALGGLFAIILASFVHWDRITTNIKIIMLSSALLSLGYASTFLYDSA